MPREHSLAALALLSILGITAAAHCPVAVSGLTPLSGEEVARIEAACGPLKYFATDSTAAEFGCEACLCAIEQAFTSSTGRSSSISSTTGPLTLDRCAREAVDVLASVVRDSTVKNINNCLTLEDNYLQRSRTACKETASGTAVPQRRSLLQSNVIPGEVNQTATDVKNTINSAAGTVQSSFNNASAGFTQLGDTSALNQASQSGNSSAGDYVNGFMNDTRRAIGVIGSVFNNSAEQSGISKLSMVVVLAAAIMLGLPLL